MEVKLEVADGKYTLVFDEATGKFYCLRYGEPWRDLVGDKMVLSLFYRIKELESKLKGDEDEQL